MYTLKHTTKDPYFNLALEEYLLKEYPLKDNLFYVWRNEPSIIIGRNQNPLNEVNIRFAEENNIPIIRRISGGGTVIHDLGNINFTYIMKEPSKVNNYAFFTEPLIAVLNRIGIKARFVPSSHIYLGEQKISGNAQAIYKNKLIHHGTLLYDMNLSQASQQLSKRFDLSGNFVKSRRADIVNVKDYIPFKTDIEGFMEFLQKEVLLNDTTVKEIQLSESDLRRIQALRNEKYNTYEWNFTYKTEISIHEKDFTLVVKKGIVCECSVKELIDKRILYHDIHDAIMEHPDKEKILRYIY